MSLGFRLSLGPSSCSRGGGAGGAAAPVGGCFLHLHLQACFWRQSREAVERVWWEDRRSTGFRGRQTSVLRPFPPPPGSVTLASGRGYASVSSFGKGRHPTSQGASSVR